MKKHIWVIASSVILLIATILLYIFAIRGNDSESSLFLAKDEFIWFDILMIIIISFLPISVYTAYRKKDDFEEKHPKLSILIIIFGIIISPIFLVFYIKLFKEDYIAYKRINQTRTTV